MASLQLDYAFLPRPNPIRASPKGGDPNTIDLDVLVSNPQLSPVRAQRVVIHIPCGDDSDRTLSADRNLPEPRYEPGSGWAVTSSGSDVTLVPPNGRVAGSFLLTLPSIAVNTTPGGVPVTITETPQSPLPGDDDHVLVK